MVRIRGTMPLQFLWQHPQFAEYVKERCRWALRLAIAAIWENLVGNALDRWRHYVYKDRMRERRRRVRLERARDIVRDHLDAWVEKHRVYHLGQAVETWKEFTAAMRLLALTAAAIKVPHWNDA